MASHGGPGPGHGPGHGPRGFGPVLHVPLSHTLPQTQTQPQPQTQTQHAVARYDPSAVGFVGGGPSFPGTEGLTPDAFKLVVASWRRLNPDISTTADFVVDVTTYAPKLPFVRQVQLIDAQIPSTQRLIEDPFCRLYFSLGVTPTPDGRRLDMEVLFPPATGLPPQAVRVVLPLPLQAVLEAIPNVDGRPGVTRLVMDGAAPYPVQAIAAAWADMPCGRLVLVGAPLATPGGGGLVLTKEMVMDADAGPTAFDVLSYPLADAVAAAQAAAAGGGGGPPLAMYVAATVLWSDEALARALTWAGTAALQASCPKPWREDCRCALPAQVAAAAMAAAPQGGHPVSGGPVALGGSWMLRFTYRGGRQEDRFAVQYTGPRALDGGDGGRGTPLGLRVLAVGHLAAYLGLDGMQLPWNGACHPAVATRRQPRLGYARIPCGNYFTPTALAAAVSAAASAYTWPAFDLGITLAGGPAPVMVTVDGGQATLDTVAAKLEAALAAGLAPVVAGVQVTATPFGLAFASVVSGAVPVPWAFALTFPSAPPGVAARLGYPALAGQTTAFAVQHDPVCCPEPHHVPEWCEGVLASMDLRADVTACGGLLLAPQPFAPFAMTAVAGPGDPLGQWATTAVSATQLVGLQPGAPVVMVGPGPDYGQTPCVVTDADPLAGTLALAQLDGTLVPAGLARDGVARPVTLVPTGTLRGAPTCAPLVLYMQTASALVDREAPVPAVALGFQPDTYTVAAPGCGIESPGTVRTRCDPYVLLCLSFTATDTTAMSGNVYYPLEVPAGGSQLVFAQVLRCNADFRTDYDRVFTHKFPGAGVHLGYIRVRLLNADGTPYCTHGHPVTVCLRMDVAGDGISMGGPGHMTLLGSNC